MPLRTTSSTSQVVYRQRVGRVSIKELIEWIENSQDENGRFNTKVGTLPTKKGAISMDYFSVL